MDYAIYPPQQPSPTAFAPQLPLSKSISNRALILDALTPGAGSRVVADCDDTDALATALASPLVSHIDVGAAGTAMRFMTAYAAATDGRNTRIDGSARMRQRPIGPLVDALRQCGADIEYAGLNGYPPLDITGRRLKGGLVEIDASVSSQFISAILMVAPVMSKGITIRLNGHTVSTPYINMTVEMMRRRGISIIVGTDTIHVAPGTYRPDPTPVEPDWSAASYWYEYRTLTGNAISIDSNPAESLQGDSIIDRIMSGIDSTEGHVDLDLENCPDLAQTIVVTLALKERPFTIRGLRTLRIKETDRLSALQCELARLGIAIEIVGDDTLHYDGHTSAHVDNHPVIATYHDHRMAMSMAFASIFHPGIVITDATVVNKSYPGFWHDMQRAGFTLKQVNN